MSSRLVRCREGHVYDAATATACPVCGAPIATPPPGDSDRGTGATEDSRAKPQPPYALLALVVVTACAVLAGMIWLRQAPAKPPSASDTGGEAHKPPVALQSKPEPGRIAAPADAPDVKEALSTPKPPDSAAASTSQPKPASDQQATATAKPTDMGGPIVFDPKLEAAGAQEKPGPLGKPRPSQDSYPPQALARIQKQLGLSDLVVDAAVMASAAVTMKQAPTRQKAALIEALAARGSASAMVTLSNAYFNRSGIRPDMERGMRHLEVAAAAGFGPARLSLARILLSGEIVERDEPRAILLLIAATRGSVEGAAAMLSSLGINPETLGVTSRQVIKWAVEGDRRTVDAARELMTAKIAGGSFALAYFGAMRSRDANLKKEVLALAKDAVQLSEVGAFHLMSVINEEGKLVPTNLNEALIWADLYHRLCPQCTARPQRLAELERRSDKERLAEFEREIERLATSGLEAED